MNATRVLIVEDDYFIATDLAFFLQEQAYAVVGPAPSVDEALSLIEVRPPDIAVLGIHLDDETSFPIANRLAALGIPFMFLTSDGLNEIPIEHRGHPSVFKLDNSRLVQQIEELLR